MSSRLLRLLSGFSRVRLFATPWTAASKAPPSMGFSRQEYWSGVPLPAEIKLEPRAGRLLVLPSSGENVGKAQVSKAEMSSFPVPPLADPVIGVR